MLAPQALLIPQLKKLELLLLQPALVLLLHHEQNSNFVQMDILLQQTI